MGGGQITRHKRRKINCIKASGLPSKILDYRTWTNPYLKYFRTEVSVHAADFLQTGRKLHQIKAGKIHFPFLFLGMSTFHFPKMHQVLSQLFHCPLK